MSEVAVFVSQKISKIRWRPVINQIINKSDTFATGSWDNDVNHVSVWKVSEEDGEPKCVCRTRQDGDVTALQYLSGDHILSCSSSGSVHLHRYNSACQMLQPVRHWEEVHHVGKNKMPCTGLATRGDDTVATCGEDGRIVVLNLEQKEVVRSIDGADSCCLNAAMFIKQSEVAVVNSIGQLKVWDLRTQQQPKTYIVTGERAPLHCLDRHPTQAHLLATAGQDKTLYIWDMRQDKFPISLLTAHEGDVWEVKFHPNRPDHLFTCSEDGSCWHWDASAMSGDVNKGSSTIPWLTSDASKHRLEVTDILPGNVTPVNCLDIMADSLVCGTDGEQIYTVNNLGLS